MPLPPPPRDGRALDADSPWLVAACYALAGGFACLAAAVAWTAATGRSGPVVGGVGAASAALCAFGFVRLVGR